MYMIKVHELRANLKDHLDQALTQDVLIERGGVVFKLSAERGTPKPTPATEPTMIPRKVNNPLLDKLATADTLEQPDCPRHHVPKNQCIMSH